MIAVDTSSFIAYLGGDAGNDVDKVRIAIQEDRLVFPPVVVAELYSARNITLEIKLVIDQIPSLDIKPGFWKRTGEFRSSLLKEGKKARLADTMIAVFCVDHDLQLITRDNDYRHFVSAFGLQLAGQ